ncbi:MAG: hypothetical protein KGH62_01940 [Candidatus Micrarchaeota archaeon]|nr:hypothetical protein [Candidatus Micrarchaeota archaeon]
MILLQIASLGWLSALANNASWFFWGIVIGLVVDFILTKPIRLVLLALLLVILFGIIPLPTINIFGVTI